MPYVDFELYASASVKITNSACQNSHFGAQQYSAITASDSSFYDVDAWDYTNVSVSNCTLTSIYAGGRTNFTLANSIVNTEAVVNAYDLNYSVVGLNPGFIHYWSFPINCSASGTLVPELIVEDTYITGWDFYSRAHTNATFSTSNLNLLRFFEFSQGTLYNVTGYSLQAYGNSRVWAVNTTPSYAFGVYGQAEIYIYWYLDVHVIDSEDSDVPYANVTARYSNSSIAETRQANSDGWARLMLMEAKTNATGNYPLENYTIIGEYEGYSGEASIEMFENQILTLQLPFVVPEFSVFLLLPLFIIVTLTVVLIFKRKQTPFS